MSDAHYGYGGLRFWSEEEIKIREHATDVLHMTVRNALLELNRGWQFYRTEGPLLTPRKMISAAYDGEDVWLLQAKLGEDELVLRPETTPASYTVAHHLMQSVKGMRAPLCVWQAGKSFRRENNDGASASKLRFNEFYQCEFQCIYAANSHADYRATMVPAVARTISWLTGQDARIVPSDRLPAYSEITEDVEVMFNGRWTEMCSISTRTDFTRDPGQAGKIFKVLEVAVGLDRLVSVANGAGKIAYGKV
jgi:glycyl-tRNA synthetase